MQVPHRCMNKLRCIFLLIHDKVKINLNCADKIIVFTLLLLLDTAVAADHTESQQHDDNDCQ